MRPLAAYRSARELPWLFALCIIVWGIGLLLVGYGIWQLQHLPAWEGINTITQGVVTGVAGIGLYCMRTWGASLFGVVIPKLEIDLLDAVRDSIPAFAKGGSAEVLGGILFVVAVLAVVSPTIIVAYLLLTQLQPPEAWRPSKRVSMTRPENSQNPEP